MVLGIHHYQQ